jgi:demethylsterigmatocystin 6-O-methyltransferase
MSFSFDVVGPVYQNLPEFLKETNYVEPKDWSHTAYQRTHNTDLPAFVHSQTRPGLLQNFALLMAARRAGESSWLDGYPIPEKTKGLKRGDQPLFIDMGGGVGHESLSLRDRYPDLPGAVVVQEIQATLDALPPSQRRAEVEYTVHDFFTPQPIKGMSFDTRLYLSVCADRDQALDSTTCVTSCTTTQTINVSKSSAISSQLWLKTH